MINKAQLNDGFNYLIFESEGIFRFVVQDTVSGIKNVDKQITKQDLV